METRPSGKVVGRCPGKDPHRNKKATMETLNVGVGTHIRFDRRRPTPRTLKLCGCCSENTGWDVKATRELGGRRHERSRQTRGPEHGMHGWLATVVIVPAIRVVENLQSPQEVGRFGPCLEAGIPDASFPTAGEMEKEGIQQYIKIA
ncbi:hypothetical protein PC115_g16710 [Phytophthora cactorum]|uniref:Uncharacterized protein n=1 Tax=Phytophthora cactorum TaxID=29920 RepID=A0A8T1BCL9_9STRA|nr:hypothetical protein PC115_g16710 [Phytophthora cactorum]